MANTLRFKRGLASGIPTGVAGEPLFTTDTFDLYIGNGTTNTRFQKYIASGTTSQYLRGDGTLATFPSLTGFVPYTGATANVDLGVYTILAQNATIASSGSGNTATITHSSGSGIALNITKGGNGEGLYINKTSGSGNAATIIGTLNATTLVKSGGLSTQYLMADGSVSTLTNPITGTGTTNYLPKFTGATTLGNSLVYDNGSGVGIGTASPSALLHINGGGTTNFYIQSGSGNQAIIRYFSGTNEVVVTRATTSGEFLFETGVGSPFEKMRLTATGNLHIGAFSSDSGEKLQVTGTAKITGGLQVGTGSSGSGTPTQNVFQDTFGGRRSVIYVKNTADYASSRGAGYSIQNGNGVEKAWFQISANDATQTDYSLLLGNSGGSLTIASTGAATFNSSVTAGQGYFTHADTPVRLNSSGTTLTQLDFLNGGTQKAAIWWNNSTNTFNFYSGVTALTIASTGAATFSSSVTALESIYPTNKSSGFSATSIFKNGNKLIIAGGSVGIQFNNSTNTSALGNVFDDGNFYIGTTATNSGYKLDVEGTARITGASSFGGNMTLSLNQNATTLLNVSNTTSGTSSISVLRATSSNGNFELGKFSSTSGTYKILTSNVGYLFNSTSGDIAILNDFSSGTIKFAAGGSSTAHMTIKSNGRINMSSLPTSATGLSAGDIWNDGGTLKIV
jgi:hypothetical protein